MLFPKLVFPLASIWIATAVVPVQQKQTAEIAQSDQIRTAKTDLIKQSRPAIPALKKPAEQLRLEQCLATNYAVTLSADRLRPWSIMHGVVAYGLDATVTTRGHFVNAVDYLCANGIGHDRQILSVENEKLKAHTGQGWQGHEGQLLAILAQASVPIDHPITVDGHSFTVMDLVKHEQAGCRTNSELTFKLIGLSCYLPSDAQWKNDQGQAWDISRLIHEEIIQPINGSACGGIHRLMGLSFALEIRKARQEPIDGQWQRIASFIENYQQYALRLQNPDGSFSTEWLEGSGKSSDPARKLYTTGHTLEWLAFSLPDEKLNSPEILRAVDRLITLLEIDPNGPKELDGFDVGPKGHALRALRLFELRVYGQPSNHQQFADLENLMLTPAQAFELQPKSKTVSPMSPVSYAKPNVNAANEPAGGRARFFRRR